MNTHHKKKSMSKELSLMFKALTSGWMLTILAAIALSLGIASETQAQIATSKEDFAGQLEQLKAELTKAIPEIAPEARAKYARALQALAQAKTALADARAGREQVSKAKGLVDHARNNWLGGAEKGIAEARVKLQQAQTPAEKQAAEAELAKWEQDRIAGQAALKERLALLEQAELEQPINERAAQTAEAALAETQLQVSNALEALDVQTFLSSDKLDAKLAKYVVLTEATPGSLADFVKQSPKHQQLISELLADDLLLVQMVVADGAKNGRYGPAMEIYDAIRQVSPKSHDGVLQRLALAIALEHAEPIAQRNAVAQSSAAAFVEPVQRYLHYEQAYLQGELDSAFSELTVWDLRMVVYGEEPDEMLTWGREMLRNYRPDHITTSDYQWRYVGAVRTDVKYGSQDCKYDQDELQFFQNILMNGGVCGRRAFFGRFILRAFGIPTTARPQKGHAALAHWTPNGWVVCLGANWGNGWTNTPYKNDFDFLATTQARKLGSSYLRVKRAHWLGDVAGEIRIFGENGGRPEFWNSVALFTQRQLIEAAKLKPLAAVGQDIAEANESKEKEPIIPVEITDDGRQISVDGSGRLTVPAAAAIKPAKSTGKILFMDSSLGGKQLHYNRNGAAEDFEYAFDAPAAGRYQLIAKVVTPSWRQSLQLRVNNSTASQEILLPFTVGTWGTTDPIEIELQAGRNQLQFSREGATAGVTIKEFTLTPIR
jgi:hypothetical protein